MRIIAFINQKGGVGKSTSAINIGAAIAQTGKKVLIVDMDPQANATIGLGVNDNFGKTIYDCLTSELPLGEAVSKTPFANLDLVPATLTLANAELEISTMVGRETLLRDSLLLSEDSLDYEFILIDLPPNLGLLTINGLAAADEVVIPIDTSIFALSGVEQLLNIIKLVKRKINPQLGIAGILVTKFDRRTNFSKEIYDDLKSLFGDKLFNNVVHQSIRIAEAQKEQKPITIYDPRSRGAEEYTAVAKELVERVNQG